MKSGVESINSNKNSLFNGDKFIFQRKWPFILQKFDVIDEFNVPLFYVEQAVNGPQNFFAVIIGIVAGFIIWFTFLLSTASISDGNLLTFLDRSGIVGGLTGCIIIAVAFSQKKSFTVYLDCMKKEKILCISKEKKFSFPKDNYIVEDVDGQLLIIVQKNLLYFLHSYWKCYQPDGAILCIIRGEDWFEILQRKLFISSLHPKWVILDKQQKFIWGDFYKRFYIFGHSSLDMSLDTLQIIDRRIALAIGILIEISASNIR